jgi:hypothetical protein
LKYEVEDAVLGVPANYIVKVILSNGTTLDVATSTLRMLYNGCVEFENPHDLVFDDGIIKRTELPSYYIVDAANIVGVLSMAPITKRAIRM